MTDRRLNWDPSRWPKLPAPPNDDGSDDPRTVEDLLEEQRERDYERGQAYWVLVPDIFPGDGHEYRLLVFDGWDERDDEAGQVVREPRFVREREWQEIRLQEETQGLREHFEAIASGKGAAPSPAADFLADSTPLRQLAREMGTSLEAVKRRLRTAGIPLIALSTHDYRVRNEHLNTWLESLTSDPTDVEAHIDASRDAIGQDGRRRRLRAVRDDEEGAETDEDDELRRRIADL